MPEQPDYRDPKWQGHTHVWPKGKRAQEVYCTECGKPADRGELKAEGQ
jgi:hypothetical protein